MSIQNQAVIFMKVLIALTPAHTSSDHSLFSLSSSILYDSEFKRIIHKGLIFQLKPSHSSSILNIFLMQKNPFLSVLSCSIYLTKIVGSVKES